jgi:hypothetical protein
LSMLGDKSDPWAEKKTDREGTGADLWNQSNGSCMSKKFKTIYWNFKTNFNYNVAILSLKWSLVYSLVPASIFSRVIAVMSVSLISTKKHWPWIAHQYRKEFVHFVLNLCRLLLHGLSEIHSRNTVKQYIVKL